MKKTLFVLVMASVMLFALSGVAMAKITNGYVTWDADPAALDGTLPTPHIGYTVNTDKCAVCHAVHNAPVAGTSWNASTTPLPDPWTARTGEETQMLLRSSVANACVYCHIETNIGGVQLYNGDATKWTSPTGFNENVAHNRGSANCVNCHSVHGSGTFKGSATSKILKAPVQASFQDEVFGTSTNVALDGGLYADRDTAVADMALGKDYQVTVFCVQCHQNFSRAAETTLNPDGDFVYGDAAYVDGDPAANKQYKSHPMKAAETTLTANGKTAAVGTVAWKASTTCRSCHDAGFTDQAAGVTDSNFPHYTAGAYNFVKVAANAAAPAVGSGNDHASDGMCLKCHVQDGTAGSAGVGGTF